MKKIKGSSIIESMIAMVIVGLVISSAIALFVSISKDSFLKRNQGQEKWRHIEISPLDKSHIITVITEGKGRYFMNGIHNKIPNDNYLLLDISEVDKLGDGFSICWNDPKGYKWKIASTYAKLVENKLDTSKYLFYQPIKKDDPAISIEYKEINCGNFMIRENREPWGDLKIKYIINNK